MLTNVPGYGKIGSLVLSLAFVFATGGVSSAKCLTEWPAEDKAFGPVVTVAPETAAAGADSTNERAALRTMQRVVDMYTKRATAEAAGYRFERAIRTAGYDVVQRRDLQIWPPVAFDLRKPSALIFPAGRAGRTPPVGLQYALPQWPPNQPPSTNVPTGFARWINIGNRCASPITKTWSLVVFPTANDPGRRWPAPTAATLRLWQNPIMSW